MNILITGSSGFIANHLAQELSHKNIIFGVDLKKSTNTKIICDVRSKLENKKLPKRIDLIINLAAIHREPGHKPNEYFDTNILGAENITSFAEQVNCRQIIFTSSISPYGVEDYYLAASAQAKIGCQAEPMFDLDEVRKGLGLD